MSYLRRTIIRRRPVTAVCILLLLTAGAAVAQYRRQAPKGPRAIGVIQWDAKGKARLVPVAIMIEGRWYDAGLYRANPVPMALDADTVYEATKGGEPVGLFTINEAGQLNDGWFALGKWREGVEAKKDEKAADLSKPKAKGEEDDRPILRRPGAQPKSEENPPPKTEAEKPKSEPAPPAKPSDEDVNRPVLRRGEKGGVEQAVSLPGNVTGASAGKAGSAGAEMAAPKRVLVAISDANRNDYRSFLFAWKPDEQQKLTTQMTDLAIRELSAYVQQHPGALPAPLQDVEVRAFDLDLVNEPELVLTARAEQASAPPPAPRRGRASEPAPAPPAAAQTVANGVEFYVTLVARQDINGDLHPLFKMVSDSRHLDVYPRMQLIDAVDADGNSHGELLFRQITDRGREFIIYRVGGDGLYALYDSSAPMQ